MQKICKMNLRFDNNVEYHFLKFFCWHKRRKFHFSPDLMAPHFFHTSPESFVLMQKCSLFNKPSYLVLNWNFLLDKRNYMHFRGFTIIRSMMFDLINVMHRNFGKYSYLLDSISNYQHLTKNFFKYIKSKILLIFC